MEGTFSLEALYVALADATKYRYSLGTGALASLATSSFNARKSLVACPRAYSLICTFEPVAKSLVVCGTNQLPLHRRIQERDAHHDYQNHNDQTTPFTHDTLQMI